MLWKLPNLCSISFWLDYARIGGGYLLWRSVYQLSLVWGWQVDKTVPDKFDLIGAFIAIAGVFVIMYFPRR